MARYKEAGLEKQEWAVSDPCDICAKNDGAIVPIGTSFPSGDTQPPAHPHCRCVLLPVIPGMEEEPDMPGATIITPPMPSNLMSEQELLQAVANLPKPQIIDEGLSLYETLDSRPYTPGEWKIVPSVAVKEAAMQNLQRVLVTPMGRSTLERYFSPDLIKKVDADFIKKAVIVISIISVTILWLMGMCYTIQFTVFNH
jgi:hypothetical protein